jgi:hypothetical protein
MPFEEARRNIMATVKLEKAIWHPYFDKISKTLVGKQTEIEVDALSIGAQIDAEWVPLLGISYDEKSDVIKVLLEGVDHPIKNPAEIFVDSGPTGLSSMAVLGSDGVKQIIKFRDPLLLPGPHPA